MRACSPLACWPPSSRRLTGENASPIMVPARRAARVRSAASHARGWWEARGCRRGGRRAASSPPAARTRGRCRAGAPKSCRKPAASVRWGKLAFWPRGFCSWRFPPYGFGWRVFRATARWPARWPARRRSAAHPAGSATPCSSQRPPPGPPPRAPRAARATRPRRVAARAAGAALPPRQPAAVDCAAPRCASAGTPPPSAPPPPPRSARHCSPC